jgi:flagellar protein FliO/FliZ
LTTVLLRRVTLASVCVWLAATAAFAADDNKIIFPSGNATTAAPTQTTGGAASSMTLILAVVLAVVGGWMVWRNRRGPGIARDGRNLAIEETRSLGNRQYLVVAAYDGKKFLIGVCPGRIDMLAPLSDSAREGKS